ncbi:hypothetical protein LUZ60_013944 [Juncus effusus]|nr:hypothetical protein LUZ60_013944 [Juncus effusus]
MAPSFHSLLPFILLITIQPSIFCTGLGISDSICPSFSSMNQFIINNNNLNCMSSPPNSLIAVSPNDIDQLQFALNLEFSEAEFFLFGALGVGLDTIDPKLALGGPPPVGVLKANLDDVTRQIVEEFGYEEVGHLRAIISTVGGFTRPLIDLSAKNFANLMDIAFGYPLNPPFNPYLNTVNYLLASYVIPYLGINGYSGANVNIEGFATRKLIAGLLSVESAQDAVIRTLLYERKDQIVFPYKYTVSEFTIQISNLRNQLGMCQNKDEGLVVPRQLGAEMRTCSNIISADVSSTSYVRTPAEILRILYMTGDERVPGGFLPNGGNGKVAKNYLFF